MQRLDLPPLWLLGCVLGAWAQARFLSLGLGFGDGWADFLSGLLIGGGLLLTALAVYEMRRQRTTVLPHKTPSHLVQSGIFSRSRNPIYLGDVLILAGFILWFDAVLSLPMIPLFTWILEKRFIVPEENRMRRAFRAEWGRYEQKTRRWV
ncbi:methyltransferase family protein [Parasedimentitalea psychrophila]|uniref:Isoprenylcysteine carboxylmethyltransferase family protein n=1 Tax=Parasedimentitalea psychrophila TaxID=2997337 RepID=A0A9Y2P764_9RHOB|nr:isoprenylcysteine carboxylmethyltransferase family protein [Parasedimentitalea psychrophila]WIY25470.1 isoprenylcysteine carboxylmethyltransferase family protein [Parasedimentitalea psychrophila]